jgi:GntR family transcriptional regulator
MLDRQSPQTLHSQLVEIIKQGIENEVWKPDSNLPSENELSRIYGVSRMTVRSVLDVLVQDEMIYKVPGKGTFVSKPKIVSNLLSQMGIQDQLEQMGYETSTRLVSIEKSLVSPKIAKILNLPINAEMYVLKRIRCIKEEPFSMHMSYMPVSLCPNLESRNLEGEQLCNILRNDYKFQIGRTVETLESTPATIEEAKLLSVKESFPLLQLDSIVYTEDNMPIEFSKVLFRGDKIKLHLEFNNNN